MKKALLAVLLAVSFVVPVFATDKGTMQLDVKAGMPVSQELKVKGDNTNINYDLDTTFSLGADFFYYIDSNIAVGAGIDHIFKTKIKYGGSYGPNDKVGITNIYLQAKYDFVLDNNIVNNIYPVIQAGYGIANYDFDYATYPPNTNIEIENGLYWAIGIGTTIKEHLIIELIYSFDYGKTKVHMPPFVNSKADTTYTSIKLNAGFKFSL